MTKDLKRVVITGLGAITPLGNSVDEFWMNVVSGKSGVGMITKFDTTNFKTKFAAEVKGFNAGDYFEKNEARKYDLFTQYAVAAADEAIKNANLDFNKLNKNKIGVIWGSGNGGIQTFQDQLEEFFRVNKHPRFNPYFIPKIIADIPSGVISIRYGLRGLNFSTISACASSNTAIIDAFNYIRLGKADIVIAGGSEAPINESGVGGFSASKALSTYNEDPQIASRPFDVKRDGFVVGEGAGAMVVESLESALARGANILAEVAGGGMAADAYHLTGTHPDGEGAYLGMLDALEDAAIEATKIDYINAHATSTMIGDESELKAIARVFGEHTNINVSATKSMTGHLLGAAGAIEAIITTKAIQNNIVPPTINTNEVEPEWKGKFNFTLSKAQAKEINYAMSNTFGFGGHIATTIFKKYKV
ncbi:beta-ketoacyl-ACP synthase II [Panacibacter ginsenosidivorans]|uniref:3-oxoacyl-[acyl-carrier-protein] synthase 2 n=1 Tax=Panacibacter ginsenosidivorans TaxID=1813871 RepID=A0A5B8V489_9BACT|nr:beta-ketoacyl-ACP synthase II [Panacibacter ginsenosidivorans]QEC66337.1 beta-ketoacyl-ACP synthase II [Panacibacter ginsenosidivorans]